jgi:hypothetical protein
MVCAFGVGWTGCGDCMHPMCVCGCVRLGSNSIKDEGCVALAGALVHVSSLTTLRYVRGVVCVLGMWGMSGECEVCRLCRRGRAFECEGCGVWGVWGGGRVTGCSRGQPVCESGCWEGQLG